MEGKQFFSGLCYGSYEPGPVRGHFNMEDFIPQIRTIVLDNPEINIYYNKAELQKLFPEDINPNTIKKVIVVKGDGCFIADFVNTIIAPAEIHVRNKLDEGSEGTFSGTFYGTLVGELQPVKLSSGQIGRSFAAQGSPEVYLKEDTPSLSQSGIPERSSPTYILGRKKGCLDYMLYLLSLIFLIWIIFWILDRGCARNTWIPVPIMPCDTVYVRDTVWVKDTITPADSTGQNLRVPDGKFYMLLNDCMQEDGDRVSVYLNDKIIVEDLLLQSAYANAGEVTLVKGSNSLKIVVSDKGSHGPCTVGVRLESVRDDKRKLFESCEQIDQYNPYFITVSY
ncbi:MAG: hypothetical protein IPM26_15180 [Saprospiraceae bacterium]|nr:hypothetical protein [Saprospiraceae bacterium]